MKKVTGWKKSFGHIFYTIAPALSLVLLFLLWVQISRGNSDLVPGPDLVMKRFVKTFEKPINGYLIFGHILASLKRIFLALIFSLGIGIPFGILIGWNKTFNAIFGTLFEFIRPIPPLAWIPMSILWFGLGDQSKFFIIFLGCFCFITVNTYDGTKNVDSVLLGAARMLGASEHQVFFRVVLPSSIPYIFAGLQIAITAGWSAVVGAEMVRSDEGVGWLIVMGMTNGNTVQIMVGMLAIGIVGYVLATAMAKLEGRLCIWNQQQGL